MKKWRQLQLTCTLTARWHPDSKGAGKNGHPLEHPSLRPPRGHPSELGVRGQ